MINKIFQVNHDHSPLRRPCLSLVPHPQGAGARAGPGRRRGVEPLRHPGMLTWVIPDRGPLMGVVLVSVLLVYYFAHITIRCAGL